MSTLTKSFFVILLLLGCVYAQDNAAQALISAHPELLVELSNYFGCGKWDSQTCLECSKNYFFNAKGICCEVSPQCRHFNQAQGICEDCYEGYALYNGTCKVITSQDQINPGCLSWDGKHNCLSCSARFYFNDQKICTEVSDFCYTWNNNGACTSCYGGYILDSTGKCVVNPTPFTPSKDSLCKTWTNNNCIACADRAYFDANGVCQGVSSNCNTWDAKTGNCLTCFGGYDLSSGSCIFSASNNAKPSDLGCNKWDWKNQVCISCSENWIFNSNKICVPVSDLCKTSNENGVCTSCYSGYDLTNGACLVSASNMARPSDLGCALWDWQHNICKSCSSNWVFNTDKICNLVNTLCKTFDNIGACTSCYQGYDLGNGICSLSPSNNAKPADLGCNNWDWNNQVCLACSKNWVFNKNGVCVPVSDQCSSSNPNGQCTSCYKGYDLKNAICVFSPTNNQGPSDGGCGKWDWINLICLQCSFGWTFNSKGTCQVVSDQCKTSDSKGACTACFKGYDLKDGTCVLSSFNKAKPSDSGCGKWDWDNQICLQCSSGWTFNANKVCTPVSDQCKTSDSKGACTACFKGYDLKDGTCVLSSFNKAKPSDSGCGKWDWDNQICLQCSSGWTFNANKVCTPVSDQCKTSDSKGACTACFKGYDLKDGTCVLSSFNKAKPSDTGCNQWDWDNQLCLKCSTNWVFNSQGLCVPVSDQCLTWDTNGHCTSCYKGYDLKNGVCTFSQSNNEKPSDLGCGKWDWNNQVCLQCSSGWTFNANKVCTPVSDQCKTSDSKGACTACFKGYDLKDGTCVLSSFNKAKPSDSGCGKWDWDNQICLQCSSGWTFNANKVCTPVSDQCKTSDSKGACTACFKGYDLKDGTCVLSSFNKAKPSDSGCGKWDWDNQICLQCSSGWTFNANKVCTPVSDQCKTSDSKGACTACFKGYDLKDGTCVLSSFNKAKPSDSGCGKWDWDNQICLQCSSGWTFNANKVCTPVSDQCKTSDSKGACTACFKGYDLKDGTCVLSSFNKAKPSDSGCGKWDWDNQICLQCSSGWTFNANKVCTPVSDQCKTSDSKGACTACFKGYDLKDGTCVLSSFNKAKPSDTGCNQWDWDNQLCLKCSTNWVFNSQGLCVPVSDQCLTWDTNGHCTSCYKGYDLKNGVCTFSQSNNEKPSDLGCGKWDWNNQVCLQCSSGWTFNANKVCTPVSDQCKTSDSKGACTACFKGYDLKDGTCVLSSFNKAKPSDSGCGKWDWDNQICLQCSSGWTFNANKVCTPVSDQCKTSDSKGACTACFTGYIISNGKCITGNPLCKTTNSNGACLSCFTGYVLINNGCTPISSLASLYLYYSQCCPQKLATLLKGSSPSS